MSPDYLEIISSIAYEILLVQRAIGNGSTVELDPIIQLPSATKYVPQHSIVWVNGLWYTSLSLSLITALVAVLTKQWLHQYMASTSGTPRDRSFIRQFRYDGYVKWGVPVIIGLLPVLMHIALGIFFFGLTIYLITQYIFFAYIVGSLSGITYIAYFISHLLSAIDSQCPYKTPLSGLLFPIFQRIYRYIHGKLYNLCCYMIRFSEQVPKKMRSILFDLEYRLRLNNKYYYNALDDISLHRINVEHQTVTMHPAFAHFGVEVLRWILDKSSNPTAKTLIIYSFGGFCDDFHSTLRLNLQSSHHSQFATIFHHIQQENKKQSDISIKYEYLIRACLNTAPFLLSRYFIEYSSFSTIESYAAYMIVKTLHQRISSNQEGEIETILSFLESKKIYLHERIWLTFIELLLARKSYAGKSISNPHLNTILKLCSGDKSILRTLNISESLHNIIIETEATSFLYEEIILQLSFQHVVEVGLTKNLKKWYLPKLAHLELSEPKQHLLTFYSAFINIYCAILENKYTNEEEVSLKGLQRVIFEILTELESQDNSLISMNTYILYIPLLNLMKIFVNKSNWNTEISDICIIATKVFLTYTIFLLQNYKNFDLNWPYESGNWLIEELSFDFLTSFVKLDFIFSKYIVFSSDILILIDTLTLELQVVSGTETLYMMLTMRKISNT